MKLIKGKKAQITRATWIFVLLLYFAILTWFLITLGEYFPNYEVNVTTINVFDKLVLNLISGISSIPNILVSCLYGIPFGFLVYLLAVSFFDAGS